LWPQNGPPWPNISLGSILGCGMINLPREPNGPNDEGREWANSKIQGASRLLRIIICESAYLIWVLRCERVIQGTNHNSKTRWTKAIDNRLQLDRSIASKTRRNAKFTNLTKSTWSPVVSPTLPPEHWANTLEVLVGIKLPRTSQTEAT
ncbi:hypothetical protein BDR03DRAFT_851645, partial [Suillus americanus]